MGNIYRGVVLITVNTNKVQLRSVCVAKSCVPKCIP